MFGGYGAVAGLVDVRGRLVERSKHRLLRSSWLLGARARDWRPEVLVSSVHVYLYICLDACLLQCESYTLFVLTGGNSNNKELTARGAISGSDSIAWSL